MNIRYKKRAFEDLQETQRYISETLHNKRAAEQLTERVFREISQLSEYPFMGVPLNSKYDIETDIRVLTVAKQLVFYRVITDKYIEIIRILDGRQDYLALLF